MAKWPILGFDGGNRIDGDAIFAAFGGNHTSTTEGEVQQQVYGTYTASNLRCYVTAFSGDTGEMFVRLRIDGADGNLAAAVDGTGEWEDISNTDSLSSGNLINVDLDHSAGMHGENHTVGLYQITLEAATNIPPIMGESSGIAWGDLDFIDLMLGFRSTTEADMEYTMRSTRTLQNLRLFVLTHTGGSDSDIHLRKNRANTSLTVTITGTGEFEDTTNTADYVAGDEANYGASDVATAPRILARSVEADTSAGLVSSRASSVDSAVNYFLPSHHAATTTTEAEAEVEAEDAATIQNLFVNCTTFAETRTVRNRKNQGDGSLSVSVTGTGIFEDLANSDSLVAEDDFAFKQDAGTSGTNTYLAYVEWETAVAAADDEEFAGTLAEDPIQHRPRREAVSYGMSVGAAQQDE